MDIIYILHIWQCYIPYWLTLVYMNSKAMKKRHQENLEKLKRSKRLHRGFIEPPLKMVCNLCGGIMIDPANVRCCGEGYCDNCIELYLYENNFNCPSCSRHITPADIFPNDELRQVFRGLEIIWEIRLTRNRLNYRNMFTNTKFFILITTQINNYSLLLMFSRPFYNSIILHQNYVTCS